MYDIVVIWAGPAWLFFASQIDPSYNILILEKSEHIGQKLLMSGGERCNFSNINVSPEHYVGTKKESLFGMLSKFGYQDIQDFLENNHVETNLENNGRLLVKSGKSREVLDLLLQILAQQQKKIQTKHEVLSIHQNGEIFTIETTQGNFESKKVILATWGIGYPQTGASDIGRRLAESLGHSVTPLHRGLCGIEITTPLEILSGSSCEAEIWLYDGQKEIFKSKWPLLFTHRWFSGPTIFNTTIALWDYRKQAKNVNKPVTQYTLIIDITPDTATKRINEQFEGKLSQLIFPIKDLRPRTESKITVGGIPITELMPYGESKKCPWLFVLGELVDITGETGGFNLQRCWTSSYLCAQYLNTKNIEK